MDSEGRVNRIEHEVVRCPRCGKHHVFPLQARSRDSGKPVLLFGGPPARLNLAFICPETQELFTEAIPDLPDREIIGPDDPFRPSSEGPPAAPVRVAAPAVQAEFAEWIKGSRAIATDFCKTLLTASSGAIPVYFAVLKYLGVETARGSWFAMIGIVPPLLFLSAIIVFAMALRPRLAPVTEQEFAEFRARRLAQLNRFLIIGLGLFAAGIVLAIVLCFHALSP
jgi:hypothetical protein